MMPTSSCLLVAAGLAAISAAQSTSVVQVVLPMVGSQIAPVPLVGSVVSAGPTATTFFVACATGTNSNDCDLGTGLSIFSGPSTLSFAFQAPPPPTATAFFVACATGTNSSDCDLGTGLSIFSYSATTDCTLVPSNDLATCLETFYSDGTMKTTTETVSGYSTLAVPVTLTAGLEKLSRPATATTTSGTTTTTHSASETTTTPSTSVTSSAGGSGTASHTSSSSSTAGVPRITQNAIVMGAAALVGGAVLL